MPKCALDIGQCSFDHAGLKRVLEACGAEVYRAQTLKEALAFLKSRQADLITVNRVLDADGSDGQEVIKQLLSLPECQGTPIMLVSNYEDAQTQAEKTGAVPGFGKDDLYDSATKERLSKYLA